MRIEHWMILFLFVLCRHVPAQGYLPLSQYFEADSTTRLGYESIEEKTTKIRITKNRELTEINTVTSFYDHSGRLIREERSGNAGTETHLSFDYDSTTGRLSHIVQTGGSVKYEAFAQYDTQGRLAEVIYCPEDKPCSARHYYYDEDNTERLYISKQAIELQFNKNKPGTLFGLSALNKEKDELSRERFFDPEGKLEEIRIYTNGTFSVGWIYEYDQAGRKNKLWAYNNSTEKTLAAEYEYDVSSGLLQSEKIYVWVVGSKIVPYHDNGPETTFLIYDLENRLIKTECSGNNSSIIREYIYNAY